MTRGASALRNTHRVFWFGVTTGALRIGRLVLVRTMAGETGQLTRALQETGTLAEVDRLMAYIPRVVEVRLGALRRWHPMALATKVIHLSRGQPARIDNVTGRRSGNMRRPRAMAGLATHAPLSRFDGPGRGQL